ncbi:MAG TPA: sigma-70 family RNA polymerase sigma factor [Planctomycetota bacterium]|nr:sigma-70 family RNA polymerase sigma factor [Planctomycetota bacterium]
MSPAQAEVSRVLVARASQGDPVAVEDLLHLHLPALRAFVRLRCGPLLRAKESSSDIVQSVCRELLVGLDRYVYPGEAGFKGWLFTAAARKIADRAEYWQAGKRDAALELPMQRGGRRAGAAGGRGAGGDDASGGAEDAAMFDIYRTACTPSQVVMGREALAHIEAAFDALPDDYREAVVLSRVLGMSRAEVAAAMGRTETAVRHLLFRGLAQLSLALKNAGGPA